MARFVLMVVIAILVLAACGVVVEAFMWGLRNGTVSQSDQERYDHRFERITRRTII